MTAAGPPLPPLELRQLVGRTKASSWEPEADPRRSCVEAGHYRCVLDFGCGAGRQARHLLMRDPPPGVYVGLDLHRGMIEWCRRELSPLDPGFSFVHHDVFNAGLNPGGARSPRPFPGADGAFTLVLATSVFTHLLEADAEYYLRECARVLCTGGMLEATWFLFDKRLFPMMQPFQNALYVNLSDPTNAVIYARDWLRLAADRAGLTLCWAREPAVRGFQWNLVLRKRGEGEAAGAFELPPDDGPLGSMPPPLMPADAERLGLS